LATLVGHVRKSGCVNSRQEKIGGPLNVSGSSIINGFAYRYFVQAIGETASIEVVLQTTRTGSI
jgi:Tfp pilus assembly protein PilX